MHLYVQQYRDDDPLANPPLPAYDIIMHSVQMSLVSGTLTVTILCRLITTLLEKGVLTPNEARYVACSHDYDWSI